MKGNGPKKAFGWRWGLLLVSGLIGEAVASEIYQSHDHPMKGMFVFPVVIGAMIWWVLLGAKDFARSLRIRLFGDGVTARIVSFEENVSTDDDGNEHTEYFPIVTYTTRTGQTCENIRLLDSVPARKFPVGTPTAIVYDPKDPVWAERKRGLASFGPVLLIMLITLALAIVFGGALLRAWAQKIMG